MSSVLASSQWHCTVALPNLHPIASSNTSSAHCASPDALGPWKQPFRGSYGLCRGSTLLSGASKIEKSGKFDPFSSSGCSPICRSHGGGALGAVDGSSCRDSVEAFVVSCSVQQQLQRRELLRAISSWILLPALINAGSSAVGVASAAEDDAPSQESSITTEASPAGDDELSQESSITTEVSATEDDEPSQESSITTEASAAEGNEPSQESSITTEAPAKNGLIERLLERSKANKAKYDKERLDAYYKRNYRDYFEFLAGGIQDKDKSKLSETEKGILSWLEKNR